MENQKPGPSYRIQRNVLVTQKLNFICLQSTD